jgi:hypothetical protein
MSAVQGSAEWLYERVGYCTASRFKDVMNKLKSGKPGEKRQTYLMELVVERITGQPADHYASAAMLWGEEQEMKSRMDYESQTGAMVEEVGFIKHPTLKWIGGSPDGLIGEDGGWESKSPFNSAHHLYTILDGMPEEHMPQVQGLMWITGRKWWDFQSYDPRLPDHLCRHVQRIYRDSGYIAALSAEVIAFTHEVEALVLRLTTPVEQQAAA